MNWLFRQRVRRAVLLASTALNKASTKKRSNPLPVAPGRGSSRRRKMLLEPMEPRMLLSADPTMITLAAASTVEISQHNTLAADGGVIVDLKVNGALTTYGD